MDRTKFLTATVWMDTLLVHYRCNRLSRFIVAKISGTVRKIQQRPGRREATKAKNVFMISGIQFPFLSTSLFLSVFSAQLKIPWQTKYIYELNMTFEKTNFARTSNVKQNNKIFLLLWALRWVFYFHCRDHETSPYLLGEQRIEIIKAEVSWGTASRSIDSYEDSRKSVAILPISPYK